MPIIDLKQQCNALYSLVLEQLQNKLELNSIHKNLIKVVEYLLEIKHIEVAEKATIEAKIKRLWQIITNIDKNSSHDIIYYKLTGQIMTSNQKQTNQDPVTTDEINIESPIYDSKSNRIQKLNDFVGQDRIKAQIKEAIDAAKIKNDTLPHVLLFGQPGLGKTSLSRIIANEMNSNIIIMSGPAIKNNMAFVPVFSALNEGDILFIDEIHRMSISAAESLYTAMEDYMFTYMDKETDTNTTINLPKFTVIGATTHSGLLDKPFRDRFSLQYKLSIYTVDEMSKVTHIKMKELGYLVPYDVAYAIANRSKGVPRILHGFINRIVDRAIVNDVKKIDVDFVETYFKDNGISKNGLIELDLAYLNILYQNQDKKTMGIDNIASSLGENRDIIESQVEPYLIYLGFVQITSSGRLITASGKEYIDSKEND